MTNDRTSPVSGPAAGSGAMALDEAAAYLAGTVKRWRWDGIRGDGRARDAGFDPWLHTNARQEDFRDVVREIVRLAARPDHAQSPGLPLRFCGYCKSWNSKPCGEQCVWTPDMPTLETLKGPDTSAIDPGAEHPENYRKAFAQGPDIIEQGRGQ